MKKSSQAINSYLKNNSTGGKGGFIKLTVQPKHTKIAKFLMLLDKDESSEILTSMPEDDVTLITSELNRIDKVDALEARQLLKEFDFLKHKPHRAQGGPDTAKKLLVEAFGEEKAGNILDKSGAKSSSKPFYFMEDLTDKQIYPLLKNESPQVIALTMNYLDKSTAAGFFQLLDRVLQKKVIKRMMKKQIIPRKVVLEIEDKIRKKLPEDREIEEYRDGSEVLANIMKYMNIDKEKHLLEELEKENLRTAQKVKDKLFTIDVILHMKERELKKVLDEFSDKDIAVILKAKSTEIQEKLKNSLSQRRLTFIEEEQTLMGKIPLSEVNIVTKEFVDYLRNEKELGRLDIPLEEDEFLE